MESINDIKDEISQTSTDLNVTAIMMDLFMEKEYRDGDGELNMFQLEYLYLVKERLNQYAYTLESCMRRMSQYDLAIRKAVKGQ